MKHVACVCWLVGLLTIACEAEMYTSLLNVKQAINVERKLIDYLRTYIDREVERLEDVRRFHSKVLDLHSKIYEGSESSSMSNPLVSFTLIKRLQSEWLNVIYSNEAEENTQALRSSYEAEGADLPELEDLQGAARGLMRLQDVYSLHVAGLARGRFQRVSDGKLTDLHMPTVSIPLTGDDCFWVGKVAYEQEDYYHSVQWLEESVRLFRGSERDWVPEDAGTLEDALDHLAFSHFKTGNVSHALSLSQELLHHDPLNRRVLQNVEKYEKLLGKNPPSPGEGLKRPSSDYLRTRDTYERLCQSQGSQIHYKNPKLFCDYFTNKSPALRLMPAKREVLSLQPYVVLYHDFITDSESDDIKRLAQHGLRRSVVAAGEKQATADYRISKSAWLKDSAGSIVEKLDHRISSLTGLNVKHPYGEYLQVVNYGIGGHYEPHFDHATSPTSPVFKLKTGNRVATFMIYLSSVQAGGSTAFIYANFSVPVVENSAIFWWNLRRNGEGDDDTLHAGCPVLLGDKWVANKWIHEHGQEFQHRCSLNPEE